MNTSIVNWIAAYNRLFTLLDKRDTPTYYSGPSFIRMAQYVNPDIPGYEKFIQGRQQQSKNTSRKSFYWDIIQDLTEQQRFQLFRLFIDDLGPHEKEGVDAIRSVVFGGGNAVPTTIVPLDLWNSEKLNASLRDIDHAIDAQQYSRATTLTYTCLEGLYKTYIRKHAPSKSNISELIPLSKVVKDDIIEKLRIRGPFPEQIVNAIPTLTNAVAHSRNGFSESHFADDAHKWLALFARDMTNSIGRLLLHFI